MSVTDQGGWGEVERRAQHHEQLSNMKMGLVTVTTEDRLRGAIVESLALIEIGKQREAHKVLQDALKIGGVK